MKKILIILTFTLLFTSCEKNTIVINDQENNTITNSGMDFIPNTLICNVGDTIYFELGTTHNAVEVSENDYNNNIGTPLANGFNIGYGESSYIVASEEKIYYYVCQPHLPGMKGVIIVE